MWSRKIWAVKMAGIVFETVRVEISPGDSVQIDFLFETVLDMCSRPK